MDQFTEEDEIRDIISIVRHSGHPTNWDINHDKARCGMLEKFYWSQRHVQLHKNCGCQQPVQQEPIILLAVSSNTNILTSNLSGLPALRTRLDLHLVSVDRRRVVIAYSQADGFTANLSGLSAFPMKYAALNLSLFQFDSNHTYEEHRAEDIIPAITKLKNAEPEATKMRRFLERMGIGGVLKERFASCRSR